MEIICVVCDLCHLRFGLLCGFFGHFWVRFWKGGKEL